MGANLFLFRTEPVNGYTIIFQRQILQTEIKLSCLFAVLLLLLLFVCFLLFFCFFVFLFFSLLYLFIFAWWGIICFKKIHNIPAIWTKAYTNYTSSSQFQKIPYLPYVFRQTGLSKQYRPRWDAAERGVSSGSTLFATHPAIFRHNIG